MIASVVSCGCSLPEIDLGTDFGSRLFVYTFTVCHGICHGSSIASKQYQKKTMCYSKYVNGLCE